MKPSRIINWQSAVGAAGLSRASHESVETWSRRLQLVYDVGLSQWNTVEVCPVRPTEEMMANVDDFPIVFD